MVLFVRWYLDQILSLESCSHLNIGNTVTHRIVNYRILIVKEL